MFRSLLDAKVYDWSYYVLAVLAIATSIPLPAPPRTERRPSSSLRRRASRRGGRGFDAPRGLQAKR